MTEHIVWPYCSELFCNNFLHDFHKDTWRDVKLSNGISTNPCTMAPFPSLLYRILSQFLQEAAIGVAGRQEIDRAGQVDSSSESQPRHHG